MGHGGDSGDARERIGAALDEAGVAAEALVGADQARDETGPGNLAWMCRTVRAGLSAYPVDKTARWLGFVHACLGHAGAAPPQAPDLPGPPARDALLHAHRVLFDRYGAIARDVPGIDAAMPDPDIPAAALSYRLGRLQGELACRGLVRVREERDVSRPLFHAAYAREGAVPPTLEGPGSAGR